MVIDRTIHSPSASQADANFQAFQEKLPELLVSHAGKLAMLHNGEAVAFFDSYADAVRYGLDKFKDFSEFSIQEVTNRSNSLGFYNYAIGCVP